MKESFFIYALGCTSPEEYYETPEKASKALVKKANELNGRWNTSNLQYDYDVSYEKGSVDPNLVAKSFTIDTGGWSSETISWRIIKIPIY